jgi:hypothetical protein
MQRRRAHVEATVEGKTMKIIAMNALAIGAVGAALGLSLPAGAKAQSFDGTYVIRSEVDNRCLDANMSDPPGTRGGRVQMWECNGLPAQRWDLIRESSQPWPYTHRLVNHYSGTCLDRPFLGAGSTVYLWPCHGGPQQSWYRYPATFRADTEILVAGDDAGYNLDYHLGTVGNGGVVQMWTAVNNPSPSQQQWWFDYQK